MFISVYLLYHSYELLKESVSILMQMVPASTDVSDIEKRLSQFKELKNVHHIHIWKLTDKAIHFECHIDLKENLRISETSKIREKTEKILHDEFGIEHVTIQFEYESAHNEECE